MLAGHYATALVAYQRMGKGTLLYFLVASMLPDLLWLVFHYLGLEVTTPENMLDVSLDTLTVDMLYSHDLLPMFVWMALLYVVGRLVFKRHIVGLVGAGLLFVHNAVDYIAGYPHHIFGPETHAVGTGAYYTAPLAAVATEALFAAVLLFVFFRTDRTDGRRRGLGNSAAIVGLFVFNILFMTLIANSSLRETFDLPEMGGALLGTMPNMVLTYLGMLFYLYFFVERRAPEVTQVPRA